MAITSVKIKSAVLLALAESTFNFFHFGIVYFFPKFFLNFKKKIIKHMTIKTIYSMFHGVVQNYPNFLEKNTTQPLQTCQD